MVHLHSFLSQNSLLDYLQELELVGDDVIYQELRCIFTEYIVHPCPSEVVQVWVHKKESKNVKEGKKQ